MSGVTVQTMIASSSVASMPRSCEHDARGFDRHIGRRDFGRGDVALRNSGSLENPLVAGVDHFLEILIGQHARRHVAAERTDFSSWQIFSPFVAAT